jgi:pimeloyl-ACP methyl ester carboxylesterase
MRSQTISGGAGTSLHVIDTGNSRGRPIVFIHGFSQCSLAWTRQLNSNLGNDYRLVAMDLRGHGLSGRPQEYSQSQVWADDVHATIQSLNLERPVLSGWSYGPLVILDYIRHYGDDAIAGIQFVGGVTKLGTDDALAVLTPEFLSLVPGFFSSNTEESVRSLSSLLDLCFVQKPSPQDLYQMLGYNVSVPHYVRQALLSRSINNDDLLPKIRKPVLVTQGTADAVVKAAATDQHRAAIRHAEVQMLPNTGHAPFWDDPETFNANLKAFCRNVWG